jgi:cytochrome P450
MVASMLESNPDKEELIKDLAGSAYIAGSDTSVAAVTSFFLAAVVYPDVQRQAQAELDRVIGRNHLPEFKDKDELPYLDAVMRECLRWFPVLPLGKRLVLFDMEDS